MEYFIEFDEVIEGWEGGEEKKKKKNSGRKKEKRKREKHEKKHELSFPEILVHV